MTSASHATLTQSIDCLRGRWRDVVELLSGRYSVWLGSGISRERFPNLGQLLRSLLDTLHARIQADDPACPYRRCVESIVQLTTIRPSNLSEASPANWQDRDGKRVLSDIVTQLWDKYADVLDQTVRVGDRTLTMTFDLLKLHEIYGDSSPRPDAEHRYLALLVAEGVLDELVTTNWDALIEAAHAECCDGSGQRLDVIAASEDIDGTGLAGQPRLTKIHGCARKTLAEPSHYQPYMLATRTDITAWVKLPERAPFREMIHQLLRERPALFIGLSGQDWNLQAECFATFMTAPPPSATRPRVTFSTPALQHPQQTFLKALYGANHFAVREEKLVKEAALPLYGKPLLGTLYVLTLLLKARTLADRGFNSPDLSAWCDFVKQGVSQWQEFLQQRYDAAVDPHDAHHVWRQMSDELPRVVTRFVTMYRDLTVLASPTAYRPLDDRHLGLLATADNVVELNHHWLLVVLAALKSGVNQSFWRLDLPRGAAASQGQFTLSLSGRTLTVFVVRDGATTLPRMIRHDLIDMTRATDVLVIYPFDREPARRGASAPVHTPSRRSLSAHRFPTRTPRRGPLEIWVRDLADSHHTPTRLVEALRRELQSA